MDEQEALDRIDAVAYDLCRAYAEFGVVCCVVRNTDERHVRIISPRLPASVMTPLLREAASAYERNDPQGGKTLN